jgi:hypothetical protein
MFFNYLIRVQKIKNNFKIYSNKKATQLSGFFLNKNAYFFGVSFKTSKKKFQYFFAEEIEALSSGE